MESTLRSRGARLVIPALLSGLCLWLAYSIIATGMAGYYEKADQGALALRWRPTSPAALAGAAGSLVRRGNYAAADAMARRSLKRSALRADALRALALSASAEDHTAAALALMSQAGQLNPRDTQTQNWLFEDAMIRGDFQRAVWHADALMRRSPEAWPALSFRLASRLGDSDVRAALVQRLSVNPPWRGTFLTMAAKQSADADVAALLQAQKHTASPATDAETTAFFSRLVAEAKYAQAKEYFDILVSPPAQPATLVYDSGFSGLPGPPPLNWQATAGQGGSASWTQDDGAPLGSLRVSHDGFSSSAPLARQLVLLSPGSYQVAARTRIDDPVAAGRFKLQIICASGSRIVSMTLNAMPGSWTSSQAAFTVPAETCEAQWLQIMPVTGDRREVAEASIDDIIVRRVEAGSPPPEVSDRGP